MKLVIREKLKKLINQEITIYIDRPTGSIHPIHSDIIYPLNYGYIKELTALDNEYQDAYLLGVNYPVKEYQGKVIAVIERENDQEDKLVIYFDPSEVAANVYGELHFEMPFEHFDKMA